MKVVPVVLVQLILVSEEVVAVSIAVLLVVVLVVLLLGLLAGIAVVSFLAVVVYSVLLLLFCVCVTVSVKMAKKRKHIRWLKNGIELSVSGPDEEMAKKRYRVYNTIPTISWICVGKTCRGFLLSVAIWTSFNCWGNTVTRANGFSIRIQTTRFLYQRNCEILVSGMGLHFETTEDVRTRNVYVMDTT